MDTGQSLGVDKGNEIAVDPELGKEAQRARELKHLRELHGSSALDGAGPMAEGNCMGRGLVDRDCMRGLRGRDIAGNTGPEEFPSLIGIDPATGKPRRGNGGGAPARLGAGNPGSARDRSGVRDPRDQASNGSWTKTPNRWGGYTEEDTVPTDDGGTMTYRYYHKNANDTQGTLLGRTYIGPVTMQPVEDESDMDFTPEEAEDDADMTFTPGEAEQEDDDPARQGNPVEGGFAGPDRCGWAPGQGCRNLQYRVTLQEKLSQPGAHQSEGASQGPGAFGQASALSDAVSNPGDGDWTAPSGRGGRRNPITEPSPGDPDPITGPHED
ncbi:MAG: hypothetical protein GY723_14770 [bacterium]|nr:hypothetical protein [bacterium]